MMTISEWAIFISIFTLFFNIWTLIQMNRKRRGAAPKRVVDQSTWEPTFGRPVSDWYRVWAWRPVHTLDRGYIWLRPYWRRRIYKKQHLIGGADFWWQNIVTVTYIAE